MSDNAQKSFLFFYEWAKPFEDLPPEDFKTLFLSMLYYQRDGKEPPQFEGNTATTAYFIFGALRRRKEASQNGLKGAAIKRQKKAAVDDNENGLSDEEIDNLLKKIDG